MPDSNPSHGIPVSQPGRLRAPPELALGNLYTEPALWSYTKGNLGLCFLALGILSAAWAAHELNTGKARYNPPGVSSVERRRDPAIVDRTENPALYWQAVGFKLVCGALGIGLPSAGFALRTITLVRARKRLAKAQARLQRRLARTQNR